MSTDADARVHAWATLIEVCRQRATELKRENDRRDRQRHHAGHALPLRPKHKREGVRT